MTRLESLTDRFRVLKAYVKVGGFGFGIALGAIAGFPNPIAVVVAVAGCLFAGYSMFDRYLSHPSEVASQMTPNERDVLNYVETLRRMGRPYSSCLGNGSLGSIDFLEARDIERHLVQLGTLTITHLPGMRSQFDLTSLGKRVVRILYDENSDWSRYVLGSGPSNGN